MPNCRERVILIETFDERDLPVREAAAELEPWRGCGAERGEWEDARANDNAAAEYLPPTRGREA